MYVTYESSNPNIICAPLCVSSVIGLFVPSALCIHPQDVALCGFIAATNIYSLAGYSQWSCATAGYVNTNPCTTPVWSGLTCSHNNVVSVILANIGLTGSFASALSKLVYLTSLDLDSNKLIGILKII